MIFLYTSLICYSIIGVKSIISYTKGGIMKDKFIGIAKVGEKGQIVIPKEAREMFNINPGDSIVVLCDKEKGIALLKSDFMEDSINEIMGGNK